MLQASGTSEEVSEQSDDLSAIAAAAQGCIKCGLSEARNSVVFGVGNTKAALMFIGEGPGAEEDAQGLPFVGRSGKLLDQLLKQEMGLERESVYITNVVKCRPPGNRDPKPEEIAECSPYLQQQLAHIRPRVIVTLGNPATKTMLQTATGITKLRGSSHAFSYPGGSATLVPTFHPSAVLRSPTNMPLIRADLVTAKQILLSQ